MRTKPLSRDAEIVAYALFTTGTPSQVILNRPRIIHPRTRAALDELTKAGMLAAINAKMLARGAMGWLATAKMGVPMLDLKAPTKAESLPVTTE
jgi:uncharacterized membrane protein